MRIISISPHDTRLSDGTVVKAAPSEVVEKLTLIDTSELIEENDGCKFMQFRRELSRDSIKFLAYWFSEQFVEYNDNLIILCPAMYASIPRPDLPRFYYPCYFVAFLATEETMRKPPQEKVAKAREFSLIWKF
jgi:hypothetical protein